MIKKKNPYIYNHDIITCIAIILYMYDYTSSNIQSIQIIIILVQIQRILPKSVKCIIITK